MFNNTNMSNIPDLPPSSDSSISDDKNLERKLSDYEITSNKVKNEYTCSEYESDEGNTDEYQDSVISRETIRNFSNIQDYELNEIMKKIPPPRKIGFNEIRDVVRNTFFSNEDYNSTAFDIMSTYIKGQKILYMEAMSYCVSNLNLLMLPTILLSAIASVMSLTVGTYVWGPIIVASLNAFNGFLLAVVNYSKLDAASEAHKISSHQYDKLQSLCEFTSGKLMVTTNKGSETEKQKEIITIKRTMDEVEAKIKDIKETNSFVIPSKIRSRFMNIYYLNIFSVVKKIRDQESLLINKLKTQVNKVRSLEYLNKIGLVDNKNKLTDNINDLNDEISDINNEIISIKTKFMIIDKMFKQEIKRAEMIKRRGCIISSCCYSSHDFDDIDFNTTANMNDTELNKKKALSLIKYFDTNILSKNI